MAVENTLSSVIGGRRADGGFTMPDEAQACAPLRAATGEIACAAADNAGSLYRLVRLDSGVVLRPESKVDLRGWGFASAKIGLIDAAGDAPLTDDGLLAATTVSGLTGPTALFEAFDAAKWGKPLWVQAGLSEDPRALVELVITTTAKATKAGKATFDIVWQRNG